MNIHAIVVGEDGVGFCETRIMISKHNLDSTMQQTVHGFKVKLFHIKVIA